MAESIQPSIFDAVAGPEIAPFKEFERTTLDNSSWVDVGRNYVLGATGLFDSLLVSVAWVADRRWMYHRYVDVPRLTAFFDEHEVLPHPILETLREQLSCRYQAAGPFTTVGLALYRGGSDSVAWHRDRFVRKSREDAAVAILSLGARRTVMLRRRLEHGRSLKFELESGDVLVMGGACQHNWEHCVPKRERPTGRRISVQFRTRALSV